MTTATPTPRPTVAAPTIAIMPPIQMRWSGRYAPVLHQVVCSDIRYSRLCRTRKEAVEYVAGLVTSGKVVLVTAQPVRRCMSCGVAIDGDGWNGECVSCANRTEAGDYANHVAAQSGKVA